MPHELKITLGDDGQLGIHGPVANEMLCYYLLEKARQTVATFHEEAAKRLVQPATVVPLGLAKGNGHG